MIYKIVEREEWSRFYTTTQTANDERDLFFFVVFFFFFFFALIYITLHIDVGE